MNCTCEYEGCTWVTSRELFKVELEGSKLVPSWDEKLTLAHWLDLQEYIKHTVAQIIAKQNTEEVFTRDN